MAIYLDEDMVGADANVIAYPVRIHDIEASDAPEKLCAIAGTAMFTMNRSSCAMNVPAARTASTNHRRGPSSPAGCESTVTSRPDTSWVITLPESSFSRLADTSI